VATIISGEFLLAQKGRKKNLPYQPNATIAPGMCALVDQISMEFRLLDPQCLRFSFEY